MAARVGIDLVSLADVRESLEAHAGRWVQRVLTPAEAAACRTGERGAERRIAARFAAKEATLKVLRPGRGSAIPWRSIEVAGGRLALHGAAARHAEAAGLGAFRLGLAHAAGHAAAFVVAARRPAVRPATPEPSSRSQLTPMNSDVHDEIRRVIGAHARLAVDPAGLAADADLYDAGMTSHASVNVMLALEDAFDVEFPDRMLKRDVFESVASIAAAVTELKSAA